MINLVTYAYFLVNKITGRLYEYQIKLVEDNKIYLILKKEIFPYF